MNNRIKGIEFLLLAVGALAGAFLRYKMVSSPLVVAALPPNILAVNVLGSFVLGIFSILSIVWTLDTKYFLLIAVGFCGSLATMSSFALESTNLLDNKQFSIFGLNILANVGLSLCAIMMGRILASTVVRLGN